ncbi:MAG: glutaredoxin domain-containing protein [bacterium]
MVFQIFAREGCEICTKAQQVLSRLGVQYQVRYVDGANASLDNLADFAFYDWTDTPPLVVVTEGDRVLARWGGSEVADASKSWHREVEHWLKEKQGAVA